MKRPINILLTESQFRRINEETEKNIMLQNIMFCDHNNISFKQVGGGVMLIVNGENVPAEYVLIKYSTLNIRNKDYDLLHIALAPELVNADIEEKIIEAWVKVRNSVVTLKSEPVGGIDTWKHLSRVKDLTVRKLTDDKGNIVAMTVEKK